MKNKEKDIYIISLIFIFCELKSIKTKENIPIKLNTKTSQKIVSKLNLIIFETLIFFFFINIIDSIT